MEFTHLHVHSHYSLLDGANRINDLARTAAAQGMTALALTDHGNLFGAVDFAKAAKAAGIRPIFGMEAYISPTTRTDRTMGQMDGASYHLLLLAMNETGWSNLVRLSSRAYLEGFYYRPRIDRELLAQFNAGLVCTTACIGGEVPRAFLAGRPEKAARIAGEYLDIFGRDRFYIEIQNQGEPDQLRVNGDLLALAKKLGVGIVGTNDVHFLRRSDKAAHEVLTCIQTGKTLDQDRELKYSEELYLKSPEEMAQTLAGHDEALRNTMRIADMCRFNLDFTRKHRPVFPTPDRRTPEDYLRDTAHAGLARRFPDGAPPPAYRERLDWELKVIQDKGYSSYFLIVHDFVDFAKRHEIPAAPRGSGVATLLGYALGIADVDPLRYGLLFERFTDPQREEDPDIDIDICQEGRERVLRYVREKYRHVAQIITYGTLRARAVIRDVGRAMSLPLARVDEIAKKVPEEAKMTLGSALKVEPELKRLYESDPDIKKLFDHALTLEGLARHSGVHAAGVVVCDEPLEGLVPLCRQSDSPEAITQWDGPTCEKAGLMKMDFLGLRTLTIIQRARELVRARLGVDVDPEKINLADPRVYDLFRRGETDAVFQFEGDGMKGVLIKMQPSRIEDLIAANAMYRPGPMKLIDDYCQCKAGRQAVKKIHPLVDDLLAETYGIMIYQEQVMQVLNRLGQLPLNRALSLIKAISKKKEADIAAERPNFLAGAAANGIQEDKAQELFDLILEFAGYGFNKAHSTRYSIVAYQTAYFKAYHPLEFWAATMTFESVDQDKVVQYMDVTRRAGIRVRPPDINTSQSDFTVDGEVVRFGLKAVKGVGGAAVAAIVAARAGDEPFKDLYDFCRRVDLRAVNRSTIEALIKCGAFDQPGGPHRAALCAALDGAVSAGQSSARDRASGQMNFFDLAGHEAAPTTYPRTPPWSSQEQLAAEKATLGFYVTSHPLRDIEAEIAGLNYPPDFRPNKIKEAKATINVGLFGLISSLKARVTKSGASAGKKMASFMIEDLTGRGEAVIFPSTYEKFADRLKEDAMFYFVGKLECGRERPNVVVMDLWPVDDARAKLLEAVELRIPAAVIERPEFLPALEGVFKKHPGNCPVRLRVQSGADFCNYYTIEPGARFGVTPTAAALADLRTAAGEGRVALVGRPPEIPRRDRAPR